MVRCSYALTSKETVNWQTATLAEEDSSLFSKVIVIAPEHKGSIQSVLVL